MLSFQLHLHKPLTLKSFKFSLFFNRTECWPRKSKRKMKFITSSLLGDICKVCNILIYWTLKCLKSVNAKTNGSKLDRKSSFFLKVKSLKPIYDGMFETLKSERLFQNGQLGFLIWFLKYLVIFCFQKQKRRIRQWSRTENLTFWKTSKKKNPESLCLQRCNITIKLQSLKSKVKSK